MVEAFNHRAILPPPERGGLPRIPIKIEALRKLGEMLKDAPKNTGAAGIGTSAVPKENRTPTLADLGLDKKTSSIAQKLAELPDDAFEQVKDGHQTVANAIMAVSKSKTPTEKKVEKETDQEEARRAQDELREQELGLLDQRILELEAEIERLKEVLAIGINTPQNPVTPQKARCFFLTALRYLVTRIPYRLM